MSTDVTIDGDTCTVVETKDSRDGSVGDNSQREYRYKVKHTASEDTACKAALQVAPDSIEDPTGGDDLYPTTCDHRPIRVDIDNADWCVWEIAVQFRTNKESNSISSAAQTGGEGNYSFNFEAATIQSHVNTAVNVTDAAACTASSVFPWGDLVNAQIDAEGNVNIQGVDVGFPSFRESLTVRLDDYYLTNSYKYTLAQYVGKMNSVEWGPYPAGAARLESVRGGYRDGSGYWEMTFSWSIKPNRIDVPVGFDPATGDHTATVDIDGWQYVWTYYKPEPEEVEINGEKILMKRPHSVYVTDLVERKDFHDLGFSL